MQKTIGQGLAPVDARDFYSGARDPTGQASAEIKAKQNIRIISRI